MIDEESSSNFSSLNKKNYFLFDIAKEFSFPEMTSDKDFSFLLDDIDPDRNYFETICRTRASLLLILRS